MSRVALKAFMKAYMGFSNRYYVPFMYGLALRKSLKKQCITYNESEGKTIILDDVLSSIKKEQLKIIKSEITNEFLHQEKVSRNMTDDSWLPLVAQYISSVRVVAREMFKGDEKQAMMFIYDTALLPPVERMMKLALGGNGRRGPMSKFLFKTNQKEDVEGKEQFDVLSTMWKIMNVANEFLQTWILSHELYMETVKTPDGDKSINVSSIKVHDCMLNRFFAAHSAQNFMPVICSFDSIWARNAFQNTGYKFRRAQTLSLNGEYCAFDFSKGFAEDEHDVVINELTELRKK